MRQEIAESNSKQPNVLILQQRRLRHLTSLCIRNMTITLPSELDSDAQSNKDPLLYFTLHSVHRDNQSVIFTSDKVHYSPNPTWSNFAINNDRHSHVKGFTVRLWISDGGTYKPALQWEISLQTLNCIGQSLYSDKVAFHSNAIVFGLHGLFYAHSTSVTTSNDLSILRTFDFTDVRNSYQVFALRRILSCKGASVQCRKNVMTMHENIKEKIRERKERNSLDTELENIQDKISHLQSILKREKSLLASEKEAANKLKWKLQQREADLGSREEELKKERIKQSEAYHHYISTQENVGHTVAQLGIRRRDILSELCHIFPISVVHSQVVSKSQKKQITDDVYTICNVKLPPSESFNHKEDLHTSVALGYTSQLLSMMSQFLLVPLRYPFVPKGSQSSIIDHVTDKLHDRERIFPIFVKGNKDRFLFDYGVFLLNKNIAQLRYYCGLGTSDLRPSLQNIRHLLEERLGAKPIIGFHSQPISISDSQHPRLQSVDSASSMTDRKFNDDALLKLNYSSASRVDDPRSQQSSQYDTFTSPSKFSQRMENRNTDLQSLRGELFGSASEIKKSRDRSPKNNRGYKEPIRALDFQSNVTNMSYRSNMNQDSVESVSPKVTHHRTHLTGLEEISQSDASKEPKIDLATARAELLGKKSAQRSHESTRWGWRSSSGSSEEYSRKRNQLFNRSNRDYSGSNASSDAVRSKADTVSSSDSDRKSETGSSRSKADSRAADDEFVFIDADEVPTIVNGNGKANSNKEPLPYMSAISRPVHNGDSQINNQRPDIFPSNKRDVFILDPDSHMDSIDQAEEELDLC